MSVSCNRRLTLWLRSHWARSELVGLPASSHPAIRDVAKTYVLQGARPAPGAERSWVQRSWRTCRLGGRTTDRQQINFTGKGGDSQAGGWGLWINKCMYFSCLEIFARKVQRLKQACAGREIRSVSLVELGSQASVEAWRKQRGIWSRSAFPFP